MPTEPEFLTTRELADLLRIKERKVYDLAAAGDVPCTKVTGKLLFPMREIEAWLAAARVGPESATARPCLFLGSHDPLLDWALRESRCGIATFFDGSLDGLSRFVAGGGIATGLHIRDASGAWNRSAVAAPCGGLDAVLIRFAARERGIVSAANAPIQSLAELAGRTVVRRQPESGAEPLLIDLLAEAGIDETALLRTPPVRTEADAALSILRGDADAALGLRALSAQYGLSFAPLVDEHFDLLIDRRAYFEPPFQTFLGFCHSDAFRTAAGKLEGYDVGDFGTVVWNAG